MFSGDGYALQRHNTENSKQIFPEKELCASVPISTFLCLWAIHIFPRSVCLFCCSAYFAAGKYVDRIWKYMNRSQTYECGNWDWGRAIPFQGIYEFLKCSWTCKPIDICLPINVQNTCEKFRRDFRKEDLNTWSHCIGYASVTDKDT